VVGHIEKYSERNCTCKTDPQLVQLSQVFHPTIVDIHQLTRHVPFDNRNFIIPGYKQVKGDLVNGS
jgi:hypothetical protein